MLSLLFFFAFLTEVLGERHYLEDKMNEKTYSP